METMWKFAWATCLVAIACGRPTTLDECLLKAAEKDSRPAIEAASSICYRVFGKKASAKGQLPAPAAEAPPPQKAATPTAAQLADVKVTEVSPSHSRDGNVFVKVFNEGTAEIRGPVIFRVVVTQQGATVLDRKIRKDVSWRPQSAALEIPDVGQTVADDAQFSVSLEPVSP
jgi:hypothetical protein